MPYPGKETYGVPWDDDPVAKEPVNQTTTEEPQGKPFDVKKAGRSDSLSPHKDSYGEDVWAPRIT